MTRELDLLELALDVALEAGELARRRREEGVSIAATKSGLADIVTEADREVERLIRDRLVVARPDDGFLGEESEPSPSTSGITWVVDPIDGTVNYAYGIPAYAVSIAAVEGDPAPDTWRALAGVVNNPATREVFRASVGGGAFLGDRRLTVNEAVDQAGALVATGFGYDPQRRVEQLAVLQRVLPLVRDVRRMGAASLDLAFVAAGRFDAYYERGLWPWDHAAGALLVTEAGGRVGGVGGAAPSRELIVAASPAFFDTLTSALSG